MAGMVAIACHLALILCLCPPALSQKKPAAASRPPAPRASLSPSGALPAPSLPPPSPLRPNQVTTGTASCALQASDFSAWCFGPNTFSQLGIGTDSVEQYNFPAMVIDPGPWQQIINGGDWTCGLKSNNLPYCWGDVSALNGSTAPQTASSPQLITGSGNWTSISAGAGYACGTTADGDGLCFGTNTQGRMVLADVPFNDNPAKVPRISTKEGWKVISASAGIGGQNFVLGGEDWLRVGNGIVNALNESLPLNSTKTNATAPVTNPGSAVSVGAHSCGLTTDSRLFCWGEGRWGQLGAGANVTHATAKTVEVAGKRQWLAVSVGPAYSCQVTVNRTLMCWGMHPARLNATGYAKWFDAVPVAIGSPRAGVPPNATGTWAALMAGAWHACALDSNGSAFCFGLNSFGAMGANTTKSLHSPVPVRVAGNLTFSDLSAGMNHTCGVATGTQAGTLWCWGSGAQGQRGDGEQTAVAQIPVQVLQTAGLGKWGILADATLPSAPPLPSPPPAPFPPPPQPSPPPPFPPPPPPVNASIAPIAGAAVVGFLAVVAAALAFWFWRRLRAAQAAEKTEDEEEAEGKSIAQSEKRELEDTPMKNSGLAPRDMASSSGICANAASPALPEKMAAGGLNLASHPVDLPSGDYLASPLVRWRSLREPAAAPAAVLQRWISAWLETPYGADAAAARPLGRNAVLGTWEFSWGDVEVERLLGHPSGRFGAVLLGRWKECRKGPRRAPGSPMVVRLLLEATAVLHQAQHAPIDRAASAEPVSSTAAPSRSSLTPKRALFNSPQASPVSKSYSTGALPPKSPSVSSFFPAPPDHHLQLPSFAEVIATAPTVAATPVAALMKEVPALARARHPNVLGFAGVCRSPPAPAFDYCARGSLHDVLHGENDDLCALVDLGEQLTWARTVRMAADAAAGMLFLHSRSPPSPPYGTLKSRNLLVTEGWRVKVAESCVARLAAAAAAGVKKKEAAEDPRWQAPELLQGREAMQASDVYAFGVCMWELLTWQKPWPNLNPWAVIGMVLSGARPLVPPAEALPAIQGSRPGLEVYVALMQHCWSQSPGERPQFSDVSNLLEGLAEVAAAMGDEWGEEETAREGKWSETREEYGSEDDG